MPINMINCSSSDKYKGYVRSHCIEEHLKTHNKVIGCGSNSNSCNSWTLPSTHQIYVHCPYPAINYNKKKVRNNAAKNNDNNALMDESASLGRQMLSCLPLKQLFLAMRGGKRLNQELLSLVYKLVVPKGENKFPFCFCHQLLLFSINKTTATTSLLYFNHYSHPLLFSLSLLSSFIFHYY